MKIVRRMANGVGALACFAAGFAAVQLPALLATPETTSVAVRSSAVEHTPTTDAVATTTTANPPTTLAPAPPTTGVPPVTAPATASVAVGSRPATRKAPPAVAAATDRRTAAATAPAAGPAVAVQPPAVLPPAAPVASPGALPKLGVSFGGYRPASRTAAFERYLGRSVGTVLVFTEENDLPSGRHDGRRMIWSPKWRMRPAATPDATILAYFRRLVELGQADAVVRPMWEANGPWMSGWFAPADPGAWIARYRHIVSLARGVPGQRFRFEWNISIAEKGPAEAESFYPGDDVVDVVGMDAYGHYPTGKWATAGTGLDWLLGFARSHGKPYGFSEWGVTDVDDQSYLDAMAAAIGRPECLYAVWNEYDAPDGDHYVEDGKYPRAAALLRSLP